MFQDLHGHGTSLFGGGHGNIILKMGEGFLDTRIKGGVIGTVFQITPLYMDRAW